MARNGSGTFVAPTGNPVVSGTVIQSTTFNTTVADIGNEITNSLPRDGQASMTAPIKIVDGTVTVPSIAFNSESASGIYRPAAGNIALTVSGVEAFRSNNGGRTQFGTTTDDGTSRVQVYGNLALTGAGNRIIGDFTNATVSNRVMFQSSVANSVTVVSAIPSGTGTQSTLNVFSKSDPSNASLGGLTVLDGAEVRLVSGITGTGTYLPISLWTSGSPKLNIAADATGTYTFSGTAPRITGDFSNATVANRVTFQTSTLNSSTIVNAIPNGTATSSSFASFGASDPNNSSYFALNALSAESRLTSSFTGTGTYSPMTFYTGGFERIRIDTSGNVGFGLLPIASTTSKLFLSGDITRIGASAGYLGNLYYAGGWKYAATSAGISFGLVDNGTYCSLIVAPANAGGSGTVASPFTVLSADGSGNLWIPSPPITANNTQAATTAFVRTVGPSFGPTNSFTTNTTLTSANYGQFTYCSGTCTLTLPVADAANYGRTITINAYTTASVTVATQSGQALYFNGASTTSVTPYPIIGTGDTVTFVNYNSNGWIAISSSSVGIGQTWQNVTGSRVVGTTYTNSTGKPIQVNVCISGNPQNANGTLVIGGVQVAIYQAYAATAMGFLSGIVPPGVTYVVNQPGPTVTILFWSELR